MQVGGWGGPRGAGLRQRRVSAIVSRCACSRPPIFRVAFVHHAWNFSFWIGAAKLAGEKTASQRLLAAYEADFELDDSQRAALAIAGEHLDTAERLDAAVREQGVTIAGSSGQTVAHPAIAEARQQRIAAFAIVKTFMSADEGAASADAASLGQSDAGMAVRSPASVKASRAASARWGRARAIAGGSV